MQHKALIILGVIAGLLLIFVAVEFAIIKYNGTEVPEPTIPRTPFTEGQGKALNYVVLGDSTAVTQGADYQKGIAIGTTRNLAENYKVTMTNFGVSGARAADVASKQVQQIDTKPDLVLLLVGSNDVTHLTSKASVRSSLELVVNKILSINCDAKIVITGSAQMGAVARFPQPVRFIAGLRSNQLNETFLNYSKERNLTFAGLGAKTGNAFKSNPALFASDKFHPNADGYAIWTEVLNQSLEEALKTQPSHCPEN